MAQIAINTDVVGSAVNRISQLVSDINTRTDKLLQTLKEKNAETKNKWTLLKKLEDKLTDEANNVKAIENAVEEIKAGLNKFIELAEEADDASALG